MDFEDTPEEAAFRQEVRAWLDTVTRRLGPERARPDRGGAERLTLAREYQRRRYERGFSGMTLPREFGGGGRQAIHQIIYQQEEAPYDNFETPEIFGIGLAMCLPTLLSHGSRAQQERFVRPGLRGDEIWCQLFSEPTGGSDAAAARTAAVRDGEDWIVNGQKTWTSGAHFADFGLITTRTNPTAPKHAGMTVFILDMRSAGVETRPIHQMSGESDFNEVFLTNVRIPDAMRIGRVDEGWKVAIATLMHERAGIGGRARDLGWRGLVRMASQPDGHGRRPIDDARVGERIVDAWLVEFGTQLLGYRAMTALSRGETPGPEQSILKMVKAPQLQRNAYLAMEMAQARGVLTPETPGPGWREVEHAWTFGASIRIAGGSDEILRNIVAERVLGLPGDVRLDKNTPFNETPV